MAKAKAATSDSTENPITVLKEATCPTSSGKSTLTYQVGIDDSGEIAIAIVGNTGNRRITTTSSSIPSGTTSPENVKVFCVGWILCKKKIP